MRRRFVLCALYTWIGWTLVDLALELRDTGRETSTEPAHFVQLLDRDGHLVATYDRAR